MDSSVSVLPCASTTSTVHSPSHPGTNSLLDQVRQLSLPTSSGTSAMTSPSCVQRCVIVWPAPFFTSVKKYSGSCCASKSETSSTGSRSSTLLVNCARATSASAFPVLACMPACCCDCASCCCVRVSCVCC